MDHLNFYNMLSEQPDIAAAIGAISRARNVAKGNIIVGQGHTDQDMYVLREGSAKVVVYSEGGHEVHLADFEPGQIFGEMAVLLGTARTSNVLALTACKVDIISASEFKKLMQRFPALALYMTRLLASRLHLTSQSLFESFAFTVPQRAYEHLCRKAIQDSDDSELYIVTPAPSVTAVSESLNVSREATSRAISKLVSQGLLKKSKSQWSLVRPKFNES